MSQFLFKKCILILISKSLFQIVPCSQNAALLLLSREYCAGNKGARYAETQENYHSTVFNEHLRG